MYILIGEDCHAAVFKELADLVREVEPEDVESYSAFSIDGRRLHLTRTTRPHRGWFGPIDMATTVANVGPFDGSGLANALHQLTFVPEEFRSWLDPCQESD